MKKILSDELAVILNGRLDFVLESYILTEAKLCVKPVYKFIEAFIGDAAIPEFCLVYCEADDPEEIFISVNSRNSDKFEKIFRQYKNYRVVLHGEENRIGGGEYKESYYKPVLVGVAHRATRKSTSTPILISRDAQVCVPYENLFSEDSYFDILYRDFIENKIYHDCGIIAVYDDKLRRAEGVAPYAGYLAYYEIAENIRDISYIYVGEKFRGLGYGKDLLNFFVNKNIDENKISYYSYADGEISEKLARSCGFLPCAKRTEAYIKND